MASNNDSYGYEAINTTAVHNSLEDSGRTDEESTKVRLGWYQNISGSQYFPYIYRNSRKYYAARIVEKNMLGKYLNALHTEVFAHVNCAKMVFMTEAEVALYNDINWDGEYGENPFTDQDYVVPLNDAHNFLNYVNMCYRIVYNIRGLGVQKCGFIRIDQQIVVCYVEHDGQKLIPTLFFEGPKEEFEKKAQNVNGWELAYLKFTCKLLNIRNELFDGDNMSVFSLEDIKNFYPEDCLFEFCEPDEDQCKLFILNNPNTDAAAPAGASTSK